MTQQTICSTCKEPDGIHAINCPGLEADIMAGRDEATRKEYAQIAHEIYLDGLNRTIERLNDMIRRVKREAMPVDPVEGRALSGDAYPHSHAAAQAIHELHWGIANAHLDTLIKNAAEADRAARDARQGRES